MIPPTKKANELLQQFKTVVDDHDAAIDSIIMTYKANRTLQLSLDNENELLYEIASLEYRKTANNSLALGKKLAEERQKLQTMMGAKVFQVPSNKEIQQFAISKKKLQKFHLECDRYPYNIEKSKNSLMQPR